MPATVYFIFGPSGAGKSTYAKELARRTPAVHFALDDWMARLFSADMPQPLEFEWMMDRIDRCEAQIWSTAAATMAAGTSVILDLGLMRRVDRARVAEIAQACDLPYEFHFLDAPREVRWERVKERQEVRTETFAIEVTPEMFEFIEGVYEAPEAEELARCLVVESGRD